MHTQHSANVAFLHNGDYSGEVKILKKDTNEVITIPCVALFEFVAVAVRRKRISDLESMTPHQVLGIPPDSFL